MKRINRTERIETLARCGVCICVSFSYLDITVESQGDRSFINTRCKASCGAI